jgi:hypothetical protein
MSDIININFDNLRQIDFLIRKCLLSCRNNEELYEMVDKISTFMRLNLRDLFTQVEVHNE